MTFLVALLTLFSVFALPIYAFRYDRWEGLLKNGMWWLLGLLVMGLGAVIFDLDTEKESHFSIMFLIWISCPAVHVVLLRRRSASSDPAVSTETAETSEPPKLDDRLLAKMKFLDIHEGSKDFEQFKARFEANLPNWRSQKNNTIVSTIVIGIFICLGVGWIGEWVEFLRDWANIGAFLILGLFILLSVFFMTQHPDYFRGTKSNGARCVWCGCKGLTYLEGENTGWYWEWRNKDGSQDKRVKDNFQQAGFKSKYNCEDCDADTVFLHYVDQKPSKDKNVWQGSLSKEGLGKRSEKDFGQGEGNVNQRAANRKGG